ncbi:unnamed protein product, partial [Hymenolepis diminuta]
EFTTLPRLIKEISCALRNSGRCGVLPIAWRASANVHAQVFSANHRSIFLQRSIESES